MREGLKNFEVETSPDNLDQLLEQLEYILPANSRLLDYLSGDVGMSEEGKLENYYSALKDVYLLIHKMRNDKSFNAEVFARMEGKIFSENLAKKNDIHAVLEGMTDYYEQRSLAKDCLDLGLSYEEVRNMEIEHVDALRQYLRDIEGSLVDANIIGRGTNGTVFALKNQDDLCIKIVKQSPSQGNGVAAEAEFLDQMTDFEVSGVKSPQVQRIFSGGGITGIVMDHLNAIELSHILSGEVDAPSSFLAEDFVKSLGEYVKQMHAEKGVAHGTISPRNIMVDIKTGKPRVIDFGNAMSGKDGGDKVYDILCGKDMAGVDSIKAQLKANFD